MSKKTNNFGFRFFLGCLALTATIPVVKADFLRAGRDAFMNYDFQQALENYEKYAAALRKTPNVPGQELLEKYMRQLEIAENSLENVQKIEIIDRIDVPQTDFFKAVKLPPSGGKLIDRNASVLKNRNNQSDFAFSSEDGDVMMWSENDENHQEVIMQCERLMDSSWEKPSKAGDILNDGGNARNPFMLSDGITLYYSSNGEGSMGGYDLFVATKDPVSGEYRQPMGLGYPFNSPYNEYMMAIDENNGIGWWVTDRNQLDGQVSVYIFKTNEVRKNYVMDEEDNIVSLARIDDISITQDPATDYVTILKDIDRRAKQVRSSDTPDFIFPMAGGRVAKWMSDFHSSSAKSDMKQYLKALAEHEQLESKLSELRRQYHKAGKNSRTKSIADQILDIESKLDWQVDRLKKMRNTIISAEIKQ